MFRFVRAFLTRKGKWKNKCKNSLKTLCFTVTDKRGDSVGVDSPNTSNVRIKLCSACKATLVISFLWTDWIKYASYVYSRVPSCTLARSTPPAWQRYTTLIRSGWKLKTERIELTIGKPADRIHGYPKSRIQFQMRKMVCFPHQAPCWRTCSLILMAGIFSTPGLGSL